MEVKLQPLQLYARLLRVARAMPTVERRKIIEVRARQGFEADRHLEPGSAEAEGRVLHAEIMLDQLEIQRDHLNDLAEAGHLKSGSTPAMEAGEVTEMASGAKVVERSNLQGCAKIANSMAALEIKE